MKRFLRFEFDTYYPGGGFEDFVGSFDDMSGAREAIAGHDNVQVVDTATGERWDLVEMFFKDGTPRISDWVCRKI